MRASISQISSFKACRRKWYLRYNELLVPVNQPESLETGKAYHAFLEELEDDPDCDTESWGFSKEAAMAKAYKKHIFNKFKVIHAEYWLEKKIGEHLLVGKVDGLSDDGHIVEHKTTSSDISEGGSYEYDLLWNEQVLAYMSLTGLRKVYYTVCRKPKIRIKKNETEEEFHNRILEWYDEDTDQKIRVFVVERTDAEVKQFEEEFVNICDTMDSVKYNLSNNPLNVYRNTCHCNMWGQRCEYSSICLHYYPEQEYVEFMRKEIK